MMQLFFFAMVKINVDLDALAAAHSVASRCMCRAEELQPHESHVGGGVTSGSNVKRQSVFKYHPAALQSAPQSVSLHPANATMRAVYRNFALLSALSVLGALCAAVKEDVAEVITFLGADVSLQCTAEPKSGVQYRAVRWYKVGEPPAPRLSGLLTRDLPNGTTRWYTGLEREVELLEESRDILLPNVTCSDGGVYSCQLSAPVGEQNREGEVLLVLTDCPNSSTKSLMRDAYGVLIPTVVLMFALAIFLMSYVSVRNIIRDRNKMSKPETCLNAPLKPLKQEDLKMIYTLGPKQAAKMKHFLV